MDDIENKIKKLKTIILNHSNREGVNELSDECDLINDLEFSSIMFIELIIDIETNFDILFDEELLIMDELSNVKQLVDKTLNIIEKNEVI